MLGQYAMKVDTQPFPSVNMVEGCADLLNDNWISHLASIWRGLCHVAMQGRKRPIPAIGPKKGKRNTSLKSK
jgi:hypothetical protein